MSSNEVNEAVDSECTPVDITTLDNRVQEVVVKWGESLLKYETATNELRNIIELVYQNGKAEFIRDREKVVMVLRNVLTKEEQEVMIKTDAFVRKRGQDDMEKALIMMRTKIVEKLNKIYRKMSNICFVDVSTPLKLEDFLKPPSKSKEVIQTTSPNAVKSTLQSEITL